MFQIISLKPEAFADLCAAGEVITRHEYYGPKVVLMSNGHYLKVFNPKFGLTKRRFFPVYKRFIRNVEALNRYHVPSVHILNLYFLEEHGSYAVEYQPLRGVDLRTLAARDPQKTLEEFIPFLVTLHEKGIYFRGIHLANVLRLEEGGYGLIDVGDCYFYRGPLSIYRRVRNLKHMLKNIDDAPLFERFGVEKFLNLYEKESRLLDLSRWFYRFLTRKK